MNYKNFTLITVVFVTILMVSAIVSTKIVDLWFFTFDGGTLLFPLSYIFGDILTEVYGYKQSRKVIWMWFGSLALMSVVIMLIWVLPAAADRPYQQDYMNVLWLTPRIVIASLIAYTAGEFSNSYIMAKMKIAMQWKKLWMRTIGSTLVGEGIDTVLFVFIAFFGVFGNGLLLTILISNYIFKVWVEILFTPLTYAIVGKLKRDEQVDHYDHDTNFNPLVFG